MSYVPDVGDVVWLEFDPQAGREQAGHRPAVVLTPKSYNQITNLLICCPLTTKIKGYPFEVMIDGVPQNVALSDQIKSLDWKVRHAKLKGKVSQQELQQLKDKLALLLDISN